jgi:hypothetical protein
MEPRNKKSRSRNRREKLRGRNGITKNVRSGGAMDMLSNYVKTFTSPTAVVGTAFSTINNIRALKDLMKNANQSYEFFKHCKSVYGSGGGGSKPRGRIEVWRRYKAALDDMHNLLNALFNNVVMTNLFSYITKSPDVKDHIEKFRMNVGEFSILNDDVDAASRQGFVSKLYTPSLILLYPDWYRYELNILNTQLLTTISELNMYPGKPKA